MKHKSLDPNVKTEICRWDKILVIYVQVIKQSYKEDGHKGKKWFLFARGLPQLLQFLLFQTEPFRKYQHNDFKMGGEKKKVAEASSNLLKFSDTSS